MEFTGERIIPGMVDPDLLLEHLSRYHFASGLASGRLAVDLACGTGYGSFLLAQNAHHVTGLDIAQGAVEFARQHYSAPNLKFQIGDCTGTELPMASIGLITAFEVIEHLQQPELLIKECQRLLTPSGILLLSTPNRLVSEELRVERNPFHIHEFLPDELAILLRRYFSYVEMGTQNHSEGIVIHFPQRLAQGDQVLMTEQSEAAAALASSQYLIAVCSNIELSTAWRNPLFVASSLGNVLLERNRHVHLLQRELSGMKARLEVVERTLGERDAHLALSQQQLEGIRDRLADVTATLDERDSHLRISLSESAQLSARIIELESIIAERDSHLRIAQAEIGGARDRVLELESVLAERNSHLSIATHEMQGLKSRLDIVESTLAERNTHISLAQSEIAGLRSRVTEVSRTLEERDSHLSIALKENSGRSVRIDFLEKELAEKSKHMQVLQKQIEIHAKNHKSLQLEVKSQNSHIQVLNQELEKLGSEAGRLERDLAQTKLELSESKRQATHLQGILNRLDASKLFRWGQKVPYLRPYLRRMRYPAPD